MRIIHCADLHLDSKLSANLDKEKRKERKAELLMTFQRLIQYAIKEEIHDILLAGDLFDTRKPSATARNTVFNAILGNPEIRFYYLRGNHDADSFLNDMEAIPHNLLLFSDTWTTYQIGDKQSICISGVELTQDNHDKIYDSLVLDTSDINIVLLHGQDEEYQVKDKAENVHIAALRGKGIDYLALGHVHSYKRSRLDARGIYCYSGCLEGRGFDECGPRGFVVLDIDERNHTITDTFVPFAGRTMELIEADITGCRTSPEIVDRVRATLQKAQLDTKSLVKLVLKGSIDVECEKDLHLLEKSFNSDFYFLKIADESVYTVDPQEFLHDQSLKGEFVRIVLSSDETEEEKASIIHYGIQALAGEEFD